VQRALEEFAAEQAGQRDPLSERTAAQ
jgi:hypothetical protein